VRTAHRVALISALAGVVAVAGLTVAGAGVDRSSVEGAREVATARARDGARAEGAVRRAGEERIRPALARAGSHGAARADSAPERSSQGDRATSRRQRSAAGTPAAAADGGLEPEHRVEPRQPAPTRIVLDPLRVEDGGLSLRATGHDARGPRELVLWRLDRGAAAVVARGRSRRDGALEFPRLVAPHRGLVLVATPAWETPDGPRASSAQIVAPRAPAPPPTAGGGRRGSARR